MKSKGQMTDFIFKKWLTRKFELDQMRKKFQMNGAYYEGDFKSNKY